jgi:hypothetical protein
MSREYIKIGDDTLDLFKNSETFLTYFKREGKEYLAQRQIICFNVYAKIYNRQRYPVKVKRAQSMIQVMFNDVQTYLQEYWKEWVCALYGLKF